MKKNSDSDSASIERKEKLLDLMEKVKSEIFRIKENEAEIGEVESRKKILELLEAVKMLKEEIKIVDHGMAESEVVVERKVEKKEKKVKEKSIKRFSKEKKEVKKTVERDVVGEINVNKYRMAWVFVLLTFGIGDIASTWLAFQGNATEGNPFLAPLLEANFWLIIPFKILIIILIFFVSYYFVWAYENDGEPSHERIAFTIAHLLIIVGIGLSLYNVYIWYTWK